MKLFQSVFLIIIMFTSVISSANTSPLVGWVMQKSETAKSEQIELINKFSENVNSALSPKSVDEINSTIFRILTTSLSDMENISKDCQKKVNSGYFLDKQPSRDSIVENFFDSTVVIKSQFCIKEHNLKKIVDIFISDQFQKSALFGIKESITSPQNFSSCQKIKIMFAGQSSFCFKRNFYETSDLIAIHSYVYKSDFRLEAPVYVRESVVLFKKIDADTVIIQNIAVGRGPDINFKSIGLKVLAQQQEHIYTKMKEFLNIPD